MKRKKFGVILLLNKMTSEANREWFLFISLFSREGEIEKNSVRERNFLLTFKAVFSDFFGLRFCNNFL